MKNSVLLIGIDGTSWNLLKPWIDNNQLPTFKKLINLGVSGNLKTVIPPLSCTAWTSLFTGINPGKHGIFQYLTREGKLINSSFIKNHKLWKILSDNKKRCCVINVPLTYPVEEINGYMISGFLTPPSEQIYSYPKELMSVLHKHNYKISIKTDKFAFVPDTKEMHAKREKFLEDTYDVLDKRCNTIKELMGERWDLFFVVFNESSSIQYLFWDKKEIILAFYKELDSYLDQLISIYNKKNPETKVLIVSDHGYSASPERIFNARTWLTNERYIQDRRSFVQKFVPKVYKKINKTPLKLIFKLNKCKEARESFQIKTTDNFPAYYRYPGFFLEDKALVDSLAGKLKNLTDPKTNEKIFKLVEKKEDVYNGEKLDQSPDLIAIPNRNFAVNFSFDSDKTLDDYKTNHPGRHFSDLIGIFLANGKKIKKGNIDVSILDIFPTILHILDVQIPKDIDGKVLREIFVENSEFYKKEIVYSEEKSTHEKDKIKDAVGSINI